MEKTLTFVVNGQSRTVTTAPERPLLEVLREDLQLTGTKYGCGEGQCGACTVLIDGRSAHACQTSVGSVDQRTILTIETASDVARGPWVEVGTVELDEAGQGGLSLPGAAPAPVSFYRWRDR